MSNTKKARLLGDEEDYTYDKSKIKRIEERMDFLITEMEKQKENNDYSAMQEFDSILNAETHFGVYQRISDFCLEKGFTRVIDIGCAYAHQNEIFKNDGVDYIGVDLDKLNFWNKDKFNFIVNRYPFEFRSSSTDLAISILCLTWNCYLDEGEKTLKEQCEALSRDFNNVIIYATKEAIKYVSAYFNEYEIIGKGLAFFHE